MGVGAEFAPIDMGSQEEQKLERKRSRNRVAATKCRKKKLEKISKLEDRVKLLKSENTDLGQILKQVCPIFYIYTKQNPFLYKDSRKLEVMMFFAFLIHSYKWDTTFQSMINAKLIH